MKTIAALDHAADGQAAMVRLNAFGALAESEMQKLSQISNPQRMLGRGETLWREGDAPPGIFVILEGWIASVIATKDGGSQMIKVHLPGDVLGMASLSLKHAAETIVALSPARLRNIPLRYFGQLFQDHPRVAAKLFLVSQEERIHLMDRLTSIARTGTVERVAATIMQLRTRVLRSFPDTGNRFAVPLTQQDLADLVGVTVVHANRVLKQLEASRLVRWSHQTVEVLNLDALCDLANLPQRELVPEPDWLPSS